MTKGKIILGAAAFLATAASTLAFRSHIQQKPVFGPTAVGGVCYTTTCFTKAGTSSVNRCHTAIATSGNKLVISSTGKLWTSRTVGGHCKNLASFTHVD